MTTEMTEIPFSRAATKAIDESIPVTERVFLALQSYGAREIYQSVDDIAAKAHLRPIQVYQALYRMAHGKKVEILKETKGGRDHIVGVKLNVGVDPVETITNGAAKAKESKQLARKYQPKVSTSIEHLSAYMSKKLAVEQARKILMDAGIDIESKLEDAFQQDDLGEEAIAIYKELVDTKNLLASAYVDLDACRQITKFGVEEPTV